MKNKALKRLILRKYKGIYKGKFGTIIGYPNFNNHKPQFKFSIDGEKIPPPMTFCQFMSKNKGNPIITNNDLVFMDIITP